MRVTGAGRIALVGIGLGGLVALAAVDGGLDVDALVLWEAPLTGRTWLRATAAYQRFVALERRPPQPEVSLADGDAEAAGFLLPAALAAGLSSLELADVPAGAWPAERPRPPALVVGATDRRVSAVVAALTARGLEPARVVLGGYEGMLDEPHRALPADAAFDCIGSWLLALSAPATPLAPPPADVPAVPAAGVVETAFRFEGVAGSLFGIECRARDSATEGLWVIFLNAAAVRHIGPNRLWVRLARQLARAGIPSLRVDASGIGESDGPEGTGGDVSRFYEPAFWDDVERAADEARRRGATRLVLVGLCSGATAGFQVAARRDDVSAVVMVNPLLLEWDDFAVADAHAEMAVRSIFRLERWRGARRWKRVLTGRVPVRAVARGAAMPLRRRFSGSPVEHLRALAERGVQVHLVVSAGDGSEVFLRRHAGPTLAQLAAPNIHLHIVHGSDHLMRPLYAQQRLAEIVSDVTGASRLSRSA
jgi:dienelactone hydrolase